MNEQLSKEGKLIKWLLRIKNYLIPIITISNITISNRKQAMAYYSSQII